jgi:hypothetical protein
MGIGATEKLHRLLERTFFLRERVRNLMREAGLEPGSATEIPEGDSIRLAFGYLERAPGHGVRQRYMEVLVPTAEFGNMADEMIDHVLEEVKRQLREVTHA